GEPDWMTGSEVALNRRHVIRKFGLMVFSVGPSTHRSVFLIHPRDHPDRAFWSQAELFDRLSHLHCGNNSGAVIYCACPEIPRIKMAGHDDYLFRMLGTFYVRNDVVALHVGQRLRRQHHMQTNLTLLTEIGDKIGIFCCNRRCGNLGIRSRIAERAGMRQTEICATNRSNQRRDRTKRSGRAWTCTAINHRLSIRIKPRALRCQLLVELCIEQHDFARDFLTPERRETFKAINNDDVSFDTVRWSGNASTERCEYDLLASSGSLPRKLDELGGLYSAHPVRHHHFLKLCVQT